MTGFIAKPIVTSQTVGERLAKVRRALGLGLPQVARACTIKVEYLEAIEQGHYGDLPGDLYAREFIKTYARFLSVNPKEAAVEYFLERQGDLSPAAREQPWFDRSGRSRFQLHLSGRFGNFWPGGLRWRLIASALALVSVAVYSFSLWRPMAAFNLSVSSPSNNYLAKDGRIVLAGRAAAAVELRVNGAPVVLDQQGFFKENLSLPPGLTLLKIEARDSAGRIRVVARAVSAPPSAFAETGAAR